MLAWIIGYIKPGKKWNGVIAVIRIRTLLSCDSAHIWWIYSAAALRDQPSDTMNQFPTQSYFPNTELTSPCFILLMPSARLGSVTYEVYMSLVWLDWDPISRSSAWEPCALLMQPFTSSSSEHVGEYIIIRQPLPTVGCFGDIGGVGGGIIGKWNRAVVLRSGP